MGSRVTGMIRQQHVQSLAEQGHGSMAVRRDVEVARDRREEQIKIERELEIRRQEEQIQLDLVKNRQYLQQQAEIEIEDYRNRVEYQNRRYEQDRLYRLNLERQELEQQKWSEEEQERITYGDVLEHGVDLKRKRQRSPSPPPRLVQSKISNFLVKDPCYIPVNSAKRFQPRKALNLGVKWGFVSQANDSLTENKIDQLEGGFVVKILVFNVINFV